MKSFGKRTFWAHFSCANNKKGTNKEVRESEATEIKSFPDLVKAVAKISSKNPEYSLYYRGQEKDYKIKSGASSCYPTIYRSPGRTLSANELNRRFIRLKYAQSELINEIEKLKLDLFDKLKKFPEVSWAILQHYEVCKTPLLDVTQSLRVAASFALNNANRDAYLYVFALPHTAGSITYSVEEELVNMKLLSICPVEAERPYFQEGYLVGSFPFESTNKHASHDVAVRLVAKYKLLKKGFWSNDFHAIPNNALYPDKDEMCEICSKVKDKLKGKVFSDVDSYAKRAFFNYYKSR